MDLDPDLPVVGANADSECPVRARRGVQDGIRRYLAGQKHRNLGNRAALNDLSDEAPHIPDLGR
jgi:hypothetical protein